MINKKNALIESLWQKAYDNLQERYGVNPDLRILNRFYSEKMALRKSDSIILWDLALKIKNKATTSGQTLTIHGGIQSSFSGHLLAATDTNPLPLHYFCPKCKGTEFIDKKCYLGICQIKIVSAVVSCMPMDLIFRSIRI